MILTPLTNETSDLIGEATKHSRALAISLPVKPSFKHTSEAKREFKIFCLPKIGNETSNLEFLKFTSKWLENSSFSILSAKTSGLFSFFKPAKRTSNSLLLKFLSISSSEFRTIVPSGFKCFKISSLALKVFSSEPRLPMCALPIFVMTAISGFAIFERFSISPRWFIPISKTAKS